MELFLNLKLYTPNRILFLKPKIKRSFIKENTQVNKMTEKGRVKVIIRSRPTVNFAMKNL